MVTKMRAHAFVLILALLVGALFPPSAARAAGEQVALFLEDKPLASVGKLIHDTTFVQLKSISTDLGLTYTGVAGNQFRVDRDDKRITMNLGNGWAVVNGHEVGCPQPVEEGGEVLIPLRFVLENLGYRLKWVGGVDNRVDIAPVTENYLVIGTVRERQETASLQIDIQYPKVVGLDLSVQGPLNAYFANRTGAAVEQGYENDRAKPQSGDYTWPTQVFLNYRVAYNQKDLLSIVFDDYLYTGGAHGGTNREGYTIDIKTGVSYALKDLFLPGADYVSLLSAEVKKQIESRRLATLTPFTRIRDDQDFYIEDDRLVVYFQQYELVAYAYGFPEFKMPVASLTTSLIPELAAREWRAD